MKTPRKNASFEQLIRKVELAEDLLEARERRVVASYQHLRGAWREGWTPLRIVAAGLVSGFLVGRTEPLAAVGGARWLQMVGAVSSLFASAQASFAAEQAGEAADTVEDAATGEAGVADEAEFHATAPRPAEAATELSEH